MKMTLLAGMCVAVISISGCGTYPQTREAFVDASVNYQGMMSSWMVNETDELAVSYEGAIKNMESQMRACIATGTQTSMMIGNGGSMGMAGATRLTQQNNPSFAKIDDNHAELTIQQYHSSTMGQPEGGFYILAADLTRRENNQTRLDVYSSKNYRPLIDAVKEWAKGSTQCHGVSGKD